MVIMLKVCVERKECGDLRVVHRGKERSLVERGPVTVEGRSQGLGETKSSSGLDNARGRAYAIHLSRSGYKERGTSRKALLVHLKQHCSKEKKRSNCGSHFVEGA